MLDWLGGGKKYQEDWASAQSHEKESQRRRGQVGAYGEQEAGARGDQQWLEEEYRKRIQGKVPSVAQEQMGAQNMANKRQQLAMARSAGGGALGTGTAVRNAQMAGAQSDVALQQSAALLRAQEQSAAEQGLGQLYGQKRAQDQALMGLGMDYERAHQQGYLETQGMRGAQHEAHASRRGGVVSNTLGAIGSGVGMAAVLSDERAKTDIEDLTPDEIEAFLEASAGKKYRYKAGLGDDKAHAGPMAQDLERSSIGASLVEEGPDGLKRLDLESGYGAMLASLHEVNKRLKKLEGGK